MEFKEYIKQIDEQNTVGVHNDGPGGAYLSSDFTGSGGNSIKDYLGHDLFIPSLDLEIPTLQKTGVITYIERNKTPIFVLLSDGTKMHFSYDEFKRLNKEPKVGHQMTVVFQRHRSDKSEQASQIQSIQIH